MISKAFIESPEYQEFKAILVESFQNKPLRIKTEDCSNEVIARQVEGYAIASKSLTRAIKKFEGQVVQNYKEAQKFI